MVVASINTHSKNSGFDVTGSSRISNRDKNAPYELTGTPGQSTTIALQTGGTAHHNITGSEETVKAILDAVSAGIGQAGSAAPVSFDQPDVTGTLLPLCPSLIQRNGREIGGVEIRSGDRCLPYSGVERGIEVKNANPASRNLLTYKDGGGIRFDGSVKHSAKKRSQNK
ncbi:MAG: hypothetical protein CM1200mP41_31330 [Gammaproteobacteria bacterium]|nr:MAG: hypothetical protein CM1200mP41_31330 [Gammaproteobacteria bacterium]